MAKQIVWNKRAYNDFQNIINYIEAEWDVNVVQNFVTRVDELIDLIADHPEIGKIEHTIKQIRGFVLTKHTTLFYRVDDQKLILLRFFDNRQEPKKKKL